MTTRSLPRTHGTRRPTRVTMCVIFGVLAALLGGALVSAAAPPSSVAEPANAEARAQLLALADARRFEPETLAKLAADPDDGIRAATARVLGELANAAASRLVARLAHDRQPRVRAEAAASAGRLASMLPAGAHEIEALGGELHRLLLDPSGAVRSAAAWGAASARLPDCDLWLLQRLGREKDPEVQAAILQELWRFSGTLWIKRATAFVANPDARVRLAATWSLARSGKPDAVADLRRASRDAEPLVRMVALEDRRLARAREGAASGAGPTRSAGGPRARAVGGRRRRP